MFSLFYCCFLRLDAHRTCLPWFRASVQQHCYCYCSATAHYFGSARHVSVIVAMKSISCYYCRSITHFDVIRHKLLEKAVAQESICQTQNTHTALERYQINVNVVRTYFEIKSTANHLSCAPTNVNIGQVSLKQQRIFACCRIKQ